MTMKLGVLRNIEYKKKKAVEKLTSRYGWEEGSNVPLIIVATWAN